MNRDCGESVIVVVMNRAKVDEVVMAVMTDVLIMIINFSIKLKGNNTPVVFIAFLF